MRIIVGSYMVRFPLGGYLSWVLQWLVGFRRLGHDVYFVEKSGWPNSCYDPSSDVMTNDCSYGIETVRSLLANFGLDKKWCFVDSVNRYYGLSRSRVQGIFKSADLFVDMGTHGAWLTEAEETGIRILIDPDPGYTQMRALAENEDLGDYDHYYSVGRNVGTNLCNVPSLGKHWRHIFDPVVVDLFPRQQIPDNAPFSTVMAWQSYKPVKYNGTTYGLKDVEFVKFIDLPTRIKTPLEIAVGGHNVPTEFLEGAGWRLANPLKVTASFDTFRQFIAASMGEFSVCKNFYVATNSGFFGSRSAFYLASGRPVVLQETGFSKHLPCGHGLFAVQTIDEAVAAIEEIQGDYEHHSKCARDIALEYLDTSRVLPRLLGEIGL